VCVCDAGLEFDQERNSLKNDIGGLLGFGAEPWCTPPFISVFQPGRQLCLKKQQELSSVQA